MDLEVDSLFDGVICDDCRGGVELVLAMALCSGEIHTRLVRRARRLAETGSFANARS